MKYSFNPRGVCSSKIDIEVEDGVVVDVVYTGGCNGNLKGIGALTKGMKIDDVIEKLKDIKCGFKDTSCPGQLAIALMQIKEAQ